MHVLHAEYRKLLTLRAFYAIPLMGLAVTAAFAVYLAGWYAKPGDLQDPRFLVTQVAGPLGIVAIFGTLVGILVMSHEYRYRTIGYALVAARRRSDVLVAKIAVVTGFAMVFTAAVDGVSLGGGYLAARIVHGHALVPQTIDPGDLLWRTLTFGWGYAIAGLVIATLIRNQVGAIVAAFLLFGPVEGLLDAVLGHRALYLPFTALGNVLKSKTVNTVLLPASPGRAALSFAVDITIAWVLAWVLFLRRDAGA